MPVVNERLLVRVDGADGEKYAGALRRAIATECEFTCWAGLLGAHSP